MRGICIAVLLLAAAAAAQESVPVNLVETKTATTMPLVLFPQARMTLVERRPGGFAGPRLSKDARYAVVTVGAHKLLLGLDTGGASALGLLYAGEAKTPAVGRARAGAGGMIVDFTDVDAGPIRIDVRLQYAGAVVKSAGVQIARHRRGEATLGGVKRTVILVDADADGAYNGEADRWISLRSEVLAQTRKLRRAETSLLAEPQIPFLPDGRALMIGRVAADGSSLTLRLGRPDVEQTDVLQRRSKEVRKKHYERFKRERAAFLRTHEIDGSRPRTFNPAKWSTVPLSRARKQAQAAGKPLLVFFYTESNAWCFRYDYYTFPDKEIDALLRKFVLVRIDIEKDTEDSHRESGARGVPSLMPLTADGRPIVFPVLNRGADGTVADLRKEERMITGWQRPQELAVNLKRILARRVR